VDTALVVSGLVAAITGLAGFVALLVTEARKEYRLRIQWLEEALTRALAVTETEGATTAKLLVLMEQVTDVANDLRLDVRAMKVLLNLQAEDEGERQDVRDRNSTSTRTRSASGK